MLSNWMTWAIFKGPLMCIFLHELERRDFVLHNTESVPSSPTLLWVGAKISQLPVAFLFTGLKLRLINVLLCLQEQNLSLNPLGTLFILEVFT